MDHVALGRPASCAAPELNEGYINAIHPISDVAALTEVDTPAEIDAPLVPNSEALPMPKEDKPHKKKHKKHHHKRERLPMPQEDTADGFTCPYLRQQAADRHAFQFADPQIGLDVLDNLESLTMADKLLEVAEKFAQAGGLGDAFECCALAQDLCTGSPCADRAAAAMLDLYVRACEPATTTNETAVSSKKAPGVEQQVSGLMKACRLLVHEGLHAQAAELARQAFAMDPERVMADPLIYKMHLLATTPAQESVGSSESSEPPACPYCHPIGKPIPGVVPNKKKADPAPTSFLVPPMPPVDYEVVPALDRVLTEKAGPAAGAEEASEEDASSSLDELIEAMMGGPGPHVVRLRSQRGRQLARQRRANLRRQRLSRPVQPGLPGRLEDAGRRQDETVTPSFSGGSQNREALRAAAKLLVASHRRIGGCQVFEDLIERHPLHAGEEIHLYGEGGEDVLFADETHGAGHLAQLLSLFQSPHRFHDAIQLKAFKDLQTDENLAELLLGGA